MISLISEYIGATSGIIGATLLAANCRYSPWAWLLFLVSSVSLTAFSVINHTYGLLAQQTTFTVINVVGVQRWLLPYLKKQPHSLALNKTSIDGQ